MDIGMYGRSRTCIDNKDVAGDLTLGAKYPVVRILDTAIEVINDNGERKVYKADRFESFEVPSVHGN